MFGLLNSVGSEIVRVESCASSDMNEFVHVCYESIHYIDSHISDEPFIEFRDCHSKIGSFIESRESCLVEAWSKLLTYSYESIDVN